MTYQIVSCDIVLENREKVKLFISNDSDEIEIEMDLNCLGRLLDELDCSFKELENMYINCDVGDSFAVIRGDKRDIFCRRV